MKVKYDTTCDACGRALKKGSEATGTYLDDGRPEWAFLCPKCATIAGSYKNRLKALRAIMVLNSGEGLDKLDHEDFSLLQDLVPEELYEAFPELDPALVTA